MGQCVRRFKPLEYVVNKHIKHWPIFVWAWMGDWTHMPENKTTQQPDSKIISALIIAAIVIFGPIGLALAAIYRREWLNNKLVLGGLCVWSLLYCISFISGVKDSIASYDANRNDDTTESQDEANIAAEDVDTTPEVSITCAKNKVHNDVTGNWRIATVSDVLVLSEHAVDYYKKCFKNDTEIHAVVNFAYKTTTKIMYLADLVNVTVYEYVDGEEHDAKKLFSGMVLTDKFYDAETGKEVGLE